MLWSYLYLFFQAFGSSKEEFEKYIANGIINWGSPVQRVLEDGDLLISQAKSSERTPMVTLCLEGNNCPTLNSFLHEYSC